MIGPKCKFCGQNHFGLCRTLGERKVKARVAEIAARPVKLGPKGRARKAKREKKSSSKPAPAPQPTVQTEKKKATVVGEKSGPK